MKPLERVLEELKDIRHSGEGYRALCPAHDDREPSLSIKEGNDGRVLLRCFAGCDTEEVVEALGLRMGDLFAESNGSGNHRGHRKVAATYDYTDEVGNLLFQVVRFEPKDFRQRRPDGRGGWAWNLKGVEPVLYRLPEVLRGMASGKPVFLCEGEKDADALASLDMTATTCPMGAGKWRDSFSGTLAGGKVVVLPDNDDAGRDHVARAAASLCGSGAKVKILELPGLPEKGDISDWLAASGTAKELVRLAGEAPVWEPKDADDGGLAVERFREPVPWPELDEAAFYGLPGEVVKVIEPHTEADPVAVLVNLLAAFGNAAGRGAFVRAESTQHHLNLFATLVGETSKARKGMSWGRVRELTHAADAEWADERVLSGLSSGEGLIHAVRDRVEVEKDGEMKVIDAGVSDKRLLLLEGEFGKVLKVMTREGNIASAVVRSAWDGEKLKTLTKNSPLTATGAHVSIIGHVTAAELLRLLSDTDAENGFANRFLWICVRRSKELPFGGEWQTVDATPLVRRLSAALEFAKTPREIRWGGSARVMWSEVYGPLSAGKPGLFGAIVSRGEAQTLRLAAMYAAMDEATTIEAEHLQAALALWRYSEQSARYIFGDATGDPVADKITNALEEEPNGLTRTDLIHLFKRNQSRDRIDQALKMLEKFGRIRREREETGGRPAERWFPQ